MQIIAPDSIQSLISEFTETTKLFFNDNLVGVYLHGSLAMGSYNPDSSDIDILIVVKSKLGANQKKEFFKILFELDKKAPKHGLELSVVTEENVRNFVYPTPYEFHFHRDHINDWIQNKIDLDEQKTDPDLAAHFTITRSRGLCLFGESIESLFSKIPSKDYLNSIALDSQWSYNNIIKGSDEGLCRVPVYAVLNFCRVLAFIREGLVVSKLEGGKWGQDNLPAEYKNVIEEATKEYIKSQSSQKVSCRVLKEFAKYAYDEISRS